MVKENDMILNMLANPQFTVTDFLSVGLTGDNTNLLPEDEYKRSDKITKNEYFLDALGNFDEAKFHNFYVGAGHFYNDLATQDYGKALLEDATFSKDNIWVSPNKRKDDYSPKLVRRPNETLVTNSLETIGKKGNRTKSISEIAQTQQVYDYATGEWKDSPNDSFFSNFFNTLVLATYDEDVVDEKTGEVIHEKGSYKLNDFGVPYYETLGGRDVYGKLVLNKMNILTTDGSTANKFDFFDSDDIDLKSLGGTVLKNLALVGSMFLPYVGPAVIGASVAVQSAGLLATLGKLIAGNGNETLNNIQGWAKTVNRSASTEYAALNTWCGENFLNMIGDTIGLLAEQRWIFKAAPTLVLGNTKVWKALSSQKGRELVIKETADELAKHSNKGLSVKELFQEIESGKRPLNLEQYSTELIAMNQRNAIKIVDKLIKEGSDISSPLAKAYMTGITVLDTYGEAKLAGASDMEAALLTIGYAAGEAAILNTGLGEWIMPEAKGNNFRYLAITKALTKEVKGAYEKLKTTQSKQGFVKDVLKIGKNIANGTYAAQAGGVKTGLNVIAANAAGEAFEEISEELLADVSKTIFNTTRWLRGEKSLNLGEWEGMRDRYLMSGLGGFIGGGITSAATDFNVAKNLASMNKTQALLELLYIVNNNEEQDFLKSLNKMELGNKRLSAEKIIQEGENGAIWAEGKGDDNLDKALKDLVTKQVSLLRDILESEGARVSTDSLINKLTLEDLLDLMKDIRFTNLRNASVLGSFLQDYQNMQADLVQYKSELLAMDYSKTDTDKEEDLLSKRSMLENKLEEVRKLKEAFDTGQRSAEFIRDAVFELNPALNNFFLKTNLVMYAEHKSGKKWNELSDSELKSYIEEYKKYSETDMKNDVHTRASMFLDMMELATPAAIEYNNFIKNYLKKEYQNVAATNKYVSGVLKYLNSSDTNNELFDVDSFLGEVQNTLTLESFETLEHAGKFSDAITQKLLDIKAKPITDTYTELAKSSEYKNTLFDSILEVMESSVQSFIDLGYINPEVKKALKDGLTLLKNDITKKIDDLYTSDAFKNLLSELYGLKTNVMINRLKLKYNSDNKVLILLLANLDKLTHTPIIKYLELFKLNATNSELNLTKHWEKVITNFNESTNNLDEFNIDSQWEEDNKEAILLINAFETVVQGMRVDNADISMPSSYSKMLNNIFPHQGVLDYQQLAEIDSQDADMILQDAHMIKNRLEFAQKLAEVNRGLKLKLQDKVAINKNYLLYKCFKRLADVVPDDWDKSELDEAISEAEFIEDYQNDKELKLNKEERNQLEAAILKIDNSIYSLFEQIKKSDGSLDVDKLSSLLRAYAGMGGFFLKTDGLLDTNTKALDDNAFIWYLASRAAVKSSDFYHAYNNAISEKIAPIASQELATYLGVAAISNMNVLNTFVDAYRQTVITDFKNLSPEERAKLLTDFDGSSIYANELLKYFGGHDVLPQYKNTIFIEGIPGSGKSKGVFASIKAVVDTIDPEIMKGVIYAHATKKSADEAVADIGFENAKTFDRESLLKFISSEWKNLKDNGKNTKERWFLYEDSYEINDEGLLINKWKTNKISDTPRVMFIDEISHYNLLEVSMIEQFAKENGIIVITAGDLDLDTLLAYTKLPDVDKDTSLILNRNNFIRTPKLGVTLRTLNKLMTLAVRQTLAAIQTIREGNEVESIGYTYLDSDPNHRGLYGVKTFTPNTTLVSESELQQLIPTIELMISTLKENEKIGYIYHNVNSPLYKLLTTKYADKINAFSGTDAQGLEGLYYIVETDISNNTDAEKAKQDLSIFLSHLYTGITRAEQGVLAITPHQYGNIKEISSTLDKTFLLEPLTELAIKKQAHNRKDALQEILEGYDLELITINRPSVTLSEKPKEDPLSEGTSGQTLEEMLNGGYTSKAKAEQVLTDFNLKLQQLGKDLEFVENATNQVYNLVKTDLVIKKQNDIDCYYPQVILELGGVQREETVNSIAASFTIRNKTNSEVLPAYNIGDEFYINLGGEDVAIKIVSIDTKEPITYTITDGDKTWTMSQSDLLAAYKGEITLGSSAEGHADDSYANNPEAYEAVVTELNKSPEIERKISSEPMIHFLYTNNIFEMGVKNIKNTPVYHCSEDVFNARIDSAIGLMHLFPKATYSELEELIAYLGNEVSNNDDNAELAEVFRNKLKLKGKVSIRFVIKSSAGTTNYLDYFRYWLDRNEESLSYMWSDDMKNAVIPMLKKVMIEVFNDGVATFEMPVASLNSPLTLLFLTNPDKTYKYPDLVNTFTTTFKLAEKDPRRKKNALFEALLSVILTYDGNSDYLEFVDLCKMWQFTLNGVFPLHKDFNLASNPHYGPQLIKRKGEKQLDAHLLFTAKSIPVEELLKNPKYHASSILMSKQGMINDKYIKNLLPAHPFILISTDNSLNTDLELIDLFIKEQMDPTVPSKVSLFYVIPPKSSVREWLLNQHNLWENEAYKKQHLIYSIGNDFTAFRILENLIASGEFDKFDSADGTADYVKLEVANLLKIEARWQLKDLVLTDKLIKGVKESDKYNELKASIGEEKARSRMAKYEMAQYLQSHPSWPKAYGVPASKTLMKRFGSYLTNIVWYKTVGMPPKITFKQDVLNAIDNACITGSHPLNTLSYVAQYSKEDIGPFIKVETSDKYSLGVTPLGSDSRFYINAKIEPETFFVDNLKEDLHYFTSICMFFDSKNKQWKLTNKGHEWEDEHYLNIKTTDEKTKGHVDTIKDKIYKEYLKYFDSGLLNINDVDETADLHINLAKLAGKFSKNRGKFGIVYNNKLYLSEMDNSNYLLTDLSWDGTDLNNLNLLVEDGNGQIMNITVFCDIDVASQTIKLINARNTSVRLIDPIPELELDDAKVKKFVEFFKEFLKQLPGLSLAPMISIMKTIQDFNSLKTKLDEFKLRSGCTLVRSIESFKKRILDPADKKFPSILKTLESKYPIPEIVEVLEAMLNYVNVGRNVSLNTDDIVRLSNNTRYRITQVNGTEIAGLLIDNNNNTINNVELILSDSDKKDMKKEEMDCKPNIWKLI